MASEKQSKGDTQTVIRWEKTCENCGGKFIDEMRKFMGRFPAPVRVFKRDTGVCPKCRDNRKVERDLEHAARYLYWTFDTVKDHFEANPPEKGDRLLVVDTSWHTNRYHIVTVDNPASGKQKRIIVSGYAGAYSGQSFYRSGKNCFAPKGQVRLIPYNKAVGDIVMATPNNEATLTEEVLFELIGKSGTAEK